MGKCIVSISNKIQRHTVYLYLETALHVSGGTSTHHQERIQLYLQNLVFVRPLLLSASIVEELEPVWVCCGWRTLLDRIQISSETLFYETRQRDVSNIWVGLISLHAHKKRACGINVINKSWCEAQTILRPYGAHDKWEVYEGMASSVHTMLLCVRV
jgi:hypothetical protein